MVGGQPPSGGCVLKPTLDYTFAYNSQAAAFGRLCVETSITNVDGSLMCGSRLRAAVCWNGQALASGELRGGSRLRAAVCWNSAPSKCHHGEEKAAAFGRLCVETATQKAMKKNLIGSRLRAAVCWNYFITALTLHVQWQPPSGGCVLKLII